jgi:acetylcholinesterase
MHSKISTLTHCSQVTIWGESAGAYSVGAHLVAYGGRDDSLFRAGIMESGNPVNYSPYHDAGFYQPSYSAIVNQTGCNTEIDTLDCLRHLPYAKLNAVLNQTAFTAVTPFQPVIDGDFIQKFTSLQLADGDFVHVPIIDGANTDEGTAFGPRGINTTAEFRAYLSGGANPATIASLPDFFATELLAAYPASLSTAGIPSVTEIGNGAYSGANGAQYRRTAAYAGDEVFIANRRLTCQTWAGAGVPAYCYRFNAIPAGIPATVGVTHFQEVAFVMNNIHGLGYAIDPFLSKPASYFALSKLMSCSWASFVADLDPNSFRSGTAGAQIAGKADDWPVYGLGSAAQNIVWDANVTSHAEPDTLRAAGIELINQGNLLYLR